METKNSYTFEVIEENENIRLKVNSFNKIEQDIFDWYCFTILDEYFIESITTAKEHYMWSKLKEIINAIDKGKNEAKSKELIYTTKSSFTFIKIFKEKTILGDLETLIDDTYEENLPIEELFLNFRMETNKFKILTLLWFKENIKHRYELGFVNKSDKAEILAWIDNKFTRNKIM